MASPSASSASNRAYSTDYELHIGLIRKLTYSVVQRAHGLGLDYEFDDAFQDASVVYIKAARGYDPSRGITFTAYLGRSIHNELNRQVYDRVTMRKECIAMSVEDLGQEDMDYLETVSIDDETMESRLISRQEMKDKVERLSPLARLFVRELNSPSRELRATLAKLIEDANARKAAGERLVRVPKSATFAIVAHHHGVPKDALYMVKREFKQKLGVDC